MNRHITISPAESKAAYDAIRSFRSVYPEDELRNAVFSIFEDPESGMDAIGAIRILEIMKILPRVDRRANPHRFMMNYIEVTRSLWRAEKPARPTFFDPALEIDLAKVLDDMRKNDALKSV